ncbi:MAG: DUF1559 domain-containing protein [Gemmataceae bacterium]
MLPYMEQDNNYNARAYYSGVPIKTFLCPSNSGDGLSPPAGSPRLIHYPAIVGYRFADYLKGGDTGVIAAYIGNGRQPVTMTSISDGTSNTVIIGERPSMPGDFYGWLGFKDYDSMIWAFVVDSTDGTSGPVHDVQRCPVSGWLPVPFPMGFGPGNIREQCDTNHLWSNHTNGANFALGDGSVRFIAYSVGAAVIGQMATRSGGEILPSF